MSRKISNYSIISVLGEGGMSRVYLGEDPISRQRVAIKELFPHLIQSEDLRNRFRREAQIMASLDHPNIVRLIRYEESEQGMFLIMEYIDGINLEQHIQHVTGPISEQKATELMKTILGAFSYAHGKGIIHRDIKPSNILITKGGDVKILDFGIAKILDVSSDPSNRTRTGTRLGTVSYMSPEQVNALSDIDVRSDIYSLGVVLHQMVTGANPYDLTASDFEIQTQIVTKPLERAKSIYPYVSDKMQWIIDKATQKDRNFRYPTCEEFIADLKLESKQVSVKEQFETIVQEPFVENTAPSHEGKNPKDYRKKRTWISLSILFSIIFLGFLMFILTKEKRDFDNALIINSLYAYDEYLAEYPYGKYAYEAHEKIYQIFSEKNTIDQYRSYLSQYPNGYFVDEAKEKIKTLELEQKDKEAYERASQSNTIASYQLYLKDYPNGLFVQEANTGISNLQPSAVFNKVWVEYNVNVDGVVGMNIHVSFDVKNMEGKLGKVVLYFYNEDTGEALVDTNESYCTTNGKVSKGSDFIPGYTNATYEDFTLFIPYDEIHHPSGEQTNCYVDVIFWHGVTEIGRKDKAFSFKFN